MCGIACHRTYGETLAMDYLSENWKYFCSDVNWPQHIVTVSCFVCSLDMCLLVLKEVSVEVTVKDRKWRCICVILCVMIESILSVLHHLSYCLALLVHNDGMVGVGWCVFVAVREVRLGMMALYFLARNCWARMTLVRKCTTKMWRLVSHCHSTDDWCPAGWSWWIVEIWLCWAELVKKEDVIFLYIITPRVGSSA